MSDDSDIETASSVLSMAGQFAFIFPGAGQVVGGAMSFVGALLGMAADQPAAGPSNQDLADDLADLKAAILSEFKKVEHEEQYALMAGAAEADLAQRIELGATKADPTRLLQKGQQEPTAFTIPNQLHKDLLDGDGGPDLRKACKKAETLADMRSRVAALTLYCNARTGLHARIQNNLFEYQVCLQYNNQLGDKTKYPDSMLYDNWWEAPILISGLTASLQEAITHAEPLLIKLKTSYRTRAARAKTFATTQPNHGQALKQEWDRITHDEFLDTISEETVDSLLGTGPIKDVVPAAPGTAWRMGVVDLWKQALSDKCKKPYDASANDYVGSTPFDRGDKLDPVRILPTTWLNAADAKLAGGFATNGGAGILSLLKQKESSVLAANDRPFLGPFRNVPKGQNLLSIVVVNMTGDPLLLAEDVYTPHGGLISKPAVVTYPKIDADPKTTQTTAAPVPNVNTGSVDTRSWVGAAPTKAMGASTASVGVWQFTSVPSDGSCSAVIKFHGLPSEKWSQLYVGGEFPKDSSKPNCASVGISDHQGADHHFTQWVDGKGVATDTSSSCYASVHPKTGSDADGNIVVTVVIN